MRHPDPLRAIADLLEKAPPGVLATIASVRGSSPAPVLSRMLVSAPGESVGTVGGGCLEAEILREAQKVRAEGGWRRVAFTLTEAEEELRMVCGGTVEILLERIDREDLPALRLLAERAARGRSTLFARLFEPGAVGAAGRVVAAGRRAPRRVLLGEEGDLLFGEDALPAEARAAAVRAIHAGQAAWSTEGRVFLEPVLGVPRVVLFGGGHVSRAVSAVAREAGFRVAVVDDRERYASPARFPDAERFVVPAYREIAGRVPLDPSDFIVVCTRGHQHDEEVLEEILRLPPLRYVGVIGSPRKHRMAERRLAEKGIPAERFRALFAPVGLDIGAVTPEEIAVAIVAEMIAVRRRARGERARHLAGAETREGAA